jgi:hypothetical protein
MDEDAKDADILNDPPYGSERSYNGAAGGRSGQDELTRKVFLMATPWLVPGPARTHRRASTMSSA